MMRVDLTPLHRRQLANRRVRIRAWIIGGAVYAAVLAAAGGIFYARASTTEASRAAGAEFKRLDTRISEAAAQTKALNAQIASAQRQIKANETAAHHPAWGSLLRALANARDEQILLRSIELARTDRGTSRATRDGGIGADAAARAPSAAQSAAGGKDAKSAKPKAAAEPPASFTLRMLGLAMTNQDMLSFIRRLESLGPIDTVQLKQAHTETLGTATVTRFEIECSMADRKDSAP